MEVNVSFARAYVLQFSPRAVKAGRLVQFAWAIVGEEHNNDLKKSGHFHTHYLRWKVINGAGDLIVETVNVEEPNIELTPPPPIAPLASHSLSVQLTDDQTKEGKLRALIEDVQCRLTVAKDEHATCLKKLEAGKVQQLSDEKFGKALSLLDEQISATKLKLASVAEDDPVTRIQLASQLEAQESMQAVLGVGSSESTNVPMLTAEVEFLADVVKEKEMQHNLLQEMLHRVEVEHRAYICPPPPSVMSPTLDNFTLPAKCAGCEYGHNVNEALMLVVLPCKHTYHSVCFATLCAFTDQCMVQYCSMAIPRDAQSTVIWGDDTVNLKPAAASVDVPVTATKVMIGTEWLENKVQDLSAANVEEEKVEEEEAEGDNVEEEAEQQELADANKDIAEVLEDLSSQGFSSVELDLGDDSPLGHFHKVLASRKGRVHLGSRSFPAKKWRPSAGEEIPKHTKRMTEVAYQNGQRVFVRPGALQFLLWCFDHFTVFVWSCAQLGAVPEHEFDGFLTEKLVNWLWHWLLAPDLPQYAKENMMHTPLDNESLSVFHFAAAEC
ncbi:hypothetical protein L7F22_060687 [Adiantum nelumboides]|nr:hypothetical protein [Adiantum nelumboides]